MTRKPQQKTKPDPTALHEVLTYEVQFFATPRRLAPAGLTKVLYSVHLAGDGRVDLHFLVPGPRAAASKAPASAAPAVPVAYYTFEDQDAVDSLLRHRSRKKVFFCFGDGPATTSFRTALD